MKITHNKVGQNLNVKDSPKSERADKATEKGIADITDGTVKKSDTDFGASKVDLSPRAQDMKKAKDIATQASDINEEKVARLQKMIDDGKYKVDAKDIAGKMVDEQLAWE